MSPAQQQAEAEAKAEMKRREEEKLRREEVEKRKAEEEILRRKRAEEEEEESARKQLNTEENKFQVFVSSSSSSSKTSHVDEYALHNEALDTGGMIEKRKSINPWAHEEYKPIKLVDPLRVAVLDGSMVNKKLFGAKMYNKRFCWVDEVSKRFYWSKTHGKKVDGVYSFCSSIFIHLHTHNCSDPKCLMNCYIILYIFVLTLNCMSPTYRRKRCQISGFDNRCG